MYLKTGDPIWDDHDQYTVCLNPDGTHFVYKNNLYINRYDIEECPECVQESLKLELGRIKSNQDANPTQPPKTQNSE